MGGNQSHYKFKEKHVPSYEPLVVLEGGVRIHYVKGDYSNETITKAIPYRQKKVRKSGAKKRLIRKTLEVTKQDMVSKGMDKAQYEKKRKEMVRRQHRVASRHRSLGGFVVMGDPSIRYIEPKQAKDAKKKIYFIRNEAGDSVDEESSFNSENVFAKKPEKNTDPNLDIDALEDELYKMAGYDKNGNLLADIEAKKEEERLAAEKKAQEEAALQEEQGEQSGDEDLVGQDTLGESLIPDHGEPVQDGTPEEPAEEQESLTLPTDDNVNPNLPSPADEHVHADDPTNALLQEDDDDVLTEETESDDDIDVYEQA